MMRGTRWIVMPSMLLALSACGGGAAPVSSPAASAATSQPAAAAKPPVSAPATSLVPASGGSAAAASGSVAGAPIRVGVIAPLTSGSAEAGLSHQSGVNLFLKQVNNTIAGRQVEAVFADSQNKADLALTKARELVESQKVQVLIGFSGTPECYAVRDYVREAHIPMIVSDNCGAIRLTADPKLATPYVFRTTFNNLPYTGPLGVWAYDQGYRKAIMAVSDFGGSLELADAFGWGFVRRGGTIVQEQYPLFGANDFGPYLAQMHPEADLVFTAILGADGLRWAQQFGDYAGQRKLQVAEAASGLNRGDYLKSIKDKAVGFVASEDWTEAIDTPANKKLMQLYAQAYPNKRIQSDAVHGYVAMQVLQAALEKTNGNIEDGQAFVNALANVNVETAKGPVKFDQQHDIVQNTYIFQVAKDGDQYGYKILKTYSNLSPSWDQPQEVVQRFPWGQMKNKWVGMTPAKLEQMTKG